MNSKIRRQLRQRKSRIQRRLDKCNVQGCERPMLTASNIHYEISDKDRGMAHGGIGVFQDLARQFGLIDAIDRQVVLFQFHLPYHESDHVLNLAYNALCGGTPVGTSRTRSSESCARASLAQTMCARCGGLKVPPRMPTAVNYERARRPR